MDFYRGQFSHCVAVHVQYDYRANARNRDSKILGASTAYIIKLILKESLLITGLGAGFGFLVTFVAIKLVLAAFPTLPVTISGQWYIVAPIIAIAGGVLGALYPAYKAATLNPVTALSYE